MIIETLIKNGENLNWVFEIGLCDSFDSETSFEEGKEIIKKDWLERVKEGIKNNIDDLTEDHFKLKFYKTID